MRSEKMIRLANKAARALYFGWWEDDQTTREIANAEDEVEAIERLEQIAWDAATAAEVIFRQFFSDWLLELDAAEELCKAEGAAGLDGQLFFRNWRKDIRDRFPLTPRRRFTEFTRIVEGS